MTALVLTGGALQSKVSAPEAARRLGGVLAVLVGRPVPEVAHEAQILIATGDNHPPVGLPFFRRYPVP